MPQNIASLYSTILKILIFCYSVLFETPEQITQREIIREEIVEGWKTSLFTYNAIK